MTKPNPIQSVIDKGYDAIPPTEGQLVKAEEELERLQDIELALRTWISDTRFPMLTEDAALLMRKVSVR